MSNQARDVVAFDYGATLRNSDGSQAHRDLVAILNRAGVDVVIVSAISLPVGRWEDEILAEIGDLKSSAGDPLRFREVAFVYYPPNPSTRDMKQAGIDKAVAMKRLGASILLDDSSPVCESVRSVGLLAIQHRPEGR